MPSRAAPCGTFLIRFRANYNHNTEAAAQDQEKAPWQFAHDEKDDHHGEAGGRQAREATQRIAGQARRRNTDRQDTRGGRRERRESSCQPAASPNPRRVTLK